MSNYGYAVAETTKNGCGALCGVRRNKGGEPAFVCDIKRIKPKNLARAAHWVRYRNSRLFEPNIQLSCFGDFN